MYDKINNIENGYSICFNEWALDKEIKNDLGLLLIISSLCAEKGYCYASNEYFSKIFNLPEPTISRKIKFLEQKKYINIEYEKRGCEIKNRYIRLTKMLIDDYQKYEPTINKNVKENNISINNISINNKKEKDNNKLLSKKKKNENEEKTQTNIFKKPTLEEVKKYCEERNNNINAEYFIDFYDSKDWMVGKNKMKDWKACVRTWEARNNNKNLDNKTNQQKVRERLEQLRKEFENE